MDERVCVYRIEGFASLRESKWLRICYFDDVRNQCCVTTLKADRELSGKDVIGLSSIAGRVQKTVLQLEVGASGKAVGAGYVQTNHVRT